MSTSLIRQHSLLLLLLLLPSLSKQSSTSAEEGWHNAFHMNVEDKVPLTIYQSERSRLRVAVADVPGPLLRVRFNIVTEAKTNDGLPHTLEHLVFMGSHNYPYKGFLDKIAYNCMADGTNGFTFQDHNGYDLQTLGQTGFLKAVPVFMDHLLGPTLSDTQFLTEVFHIDGKGNEGGVVYSEMQGHEQNMYSLVDKKLRKMFYGPKSSFATDCSGELTNLRNTCTLDKIRKYHRENYHLDNMLIFITGIIDHQALLKAVSVVEGQFLSQIPGSFLRPFSTEQRPKIAAGRRENKSVKIWSPSSDKANGMVQIAWPGPEWSDFENNLALALLAVYLTSSNSSPLQRKMCRLADKPFCTGVGISLESRKLYEIRAVFYGVPVDKVDEVKRRFLEIIQSETTADFDLDQMHSLIGLALRSYDASLEEDPHGVFGATVLLHQIYGKRMNEQEEEEEEVIGEYSYKQLDQYLNRKVIVKALLQKNAHFWTQLLREYFLENNYVCVRAVPSKTLIKLRNVKEKIRLIWRNLLLGKKGRMSKQRALDSAVDEHKRNQPSKEEVDKFMVKEYDGFDIIRVQSYRSDAHQNKQATDELHHQRAEASSSSSAAVHNIWLPTNIPFLSHLHGIDSEFVELVLLFNVEHHLTNEEHHWLRLLMGLTFQSPVVHEGSQLNLEQIDKLYNQQLVNFSLELGIGGCIGTGRLWSATVRTEAAQIHRMPEWLRLYLADTVYERDNALTCLNGLIKNAEMSRDDPKTIADFMHVRIMDGKESRFYGYKVDLALEKFHRHIKAKLESGNEADTRLVREKLNAVREKLLRTPVNLHFIGRADVLAEHKNVLDNPESWNFLTGHTTKPVHVSSNDNNNGDKKDGGNEEIHDHHDNNNNNTKEALISGLGETNAVEVGGSESAYLVATAQLDAGYHGWTHPATMAIKLLCAYMNQLEGPLWNAVRAPGLAYGVQLSVAPGRGQIHLHLTNCAKLIEAYEASKRIVLQILDENMLDESLFESAKRSLLSQVITSFQGSNPVDAGWAAMLNTLRELPPNYFYEQFGRQLWTASMEEVLALGAPALRRLFQPETSLRSIGFHPSRKAELEQAFAGIRFREMHEFQVETMPTIPRVPSEDVANDSV